MRFRSRAPRNPLVVLVKQRKAGSHTPNAKVQRLRDKHKLRKTIKQET
jgi:hypothetical protein